MNHSKSGRFSKALDAQEKLFQLYSSQKGKVQIEEIAKAAHYGGKKEPGMEEPIMVPLGFGDPFYWSPEICDLVFRSSTSIPQIWSLRSEGIESLCGFAWLGKSFQSNPPGADEPEAVRAISWVPFTTDGDNLVLVLPPYSYNPLLDTSRDNGLAVCLWVEMPMLHLPPYLKEFSGWPIPSARLFWPLDKSLKQVAGQDKLSVERFSLFASMLAFLEQRILIPVDHTADKAVRRFVTKMAPSREPVVRVITLRRAHRYPSGVHRDVEWTCRWIVGGYWRNQSYGPTGQKHYRPKWIAPYMKGPDDKPLRHPERLFAVVR